MISSEDNLEPLGAAKNKFLCVGSILGKSSNFKPNLEEGLGFIK